MPTRATIRSLRLIFPLAWASMLAAVGSDAGAMITVGFDRPVYTVAPGPASFQVHVLLDAEPSAAGPQPLPAGLFSYGWELTFQASNATADAIAVVPELDYLGFQPAAQTTLAAGGGRAKGNVSQSPLAPYFGTTLATVALTNLAPAPGAWTLTLGPARDFPAESLFLDGLGTVLDDRIVFGTATVLVPEPSALGAIVAVLLALSPRAGRSHATANRAPATCGTAAGAPSA